MGGETYAFSGALDKTYVLKNDLEHFLSTKILFLCSLILWTYEGFPSFSIMGRVGSCIALNADSTQSLFGR